MSTLYELTAEYNEVLEMMDNPDIDVQCVLDTLEGIEGEIEIKAENYAKIIKEAEGKTAMLDGEISRLTERKNAIKSRIAGMKQSLMLAMKAVNKEKFKTDLFSFSIQKNPPSVILDKPESVPEKYLTPQSPTVNKKEILAAIKDGADFDFAHIEQSEGVRIR